MRSMFDANIQELMNLVKANEESENFALNVIIHSCGTYGCLVGNHFIYHKPIINKQLTGTTAAMVWCMSKKRYKLNDRLHSFLFCEHEYNSRGRIKKDDKTGEEILRDYKDKKAALNRVRKYIYYILKKKELMPNRSTKEGREKYEKSRKLGDVNVSREVLCQVH